MYPVITVSLALALVAAVLVLNRELKLRRSMQYILSHLLNERRTGESEPNSGNDAEHPAHRV